MDLRFLLIRSFVMVAPLGLLCAFVEWRLSQLPNSHTLKKNHIEQHLADSEVLVLGSSQMLYAVNPQWMSHKAVNLANVSQSLWYDAALLEKYISNMPRLKTVCVAVSYHSFFADLSSTTEYWRDYFYERYWGLYSPTARPDFLRRHFYYYMYGRGQSLKLLTGLGSSGEMTAGAIQEGGWLPGDTTTWRELISDESGRQRIVSLHQEQDSLTGPAQWAALEKLLQLSQKHGVKVLLVTPPLCNTFRKHMDAAYWGAAQRKALALCAACSGCRYVDLSNAEQLQLPPQYFFDNDHLNAKGAAVFSKILNSLVTDVSGTSKHRD